MPGVTEGNALISLGDPLLRAVILSLAASAASVGLIRLFFGEGRGSNLASAGLAIGAVIAWIIAFGLPSWAAYSMADKAALLMLLGLLFGLMADRLPVLEPAFVLILAGWPVALLFWLWTPALGNGLSPHQIQRFAILLIAAITLFMRLRDDQDHGQAGPMLLLWLGAALGIVAAISGLPQLSGAGAALAAACAGYMLWNIPVTRYPFGLAALIVGGTAAAALAASLLAEGVRAPLWPLLALLFAGDIGARLMRQGRGARGVALGGLVPVIAAIILAYMVR